MRYLILLLCLSSSAFGQAVLTFTDGPCCRVVWQDGKAFYVMQDANTTVVISGPSNYSASLHSVQIQIRQDGDTPIDVDPARFEAVAEDPQHTQLAYLDMNAKATHNRKRRAIISGILLGISAGASGAAASMPQTATVNNSDGTSSTITYTDPTPKQEQMLRQWKTAKPQRLIMRPPFKPRRETSSAIQRLPKAIRLRVRYFFKAQRA
jgi:hypothetical protein